MSSSISSYYVYCNNKKKWFSKNSKICIVRNEHPVYGVIVGAFDSDLSAIEYISDKMQNEGNSLVLMEMPWYYFDGFLNEYNDTYKHKFIRSLYFCNDNDLDSEERFWFEIVDKNYYNNLIFFNNYFKNYRKGIRDNLII